jgi:NhaP-type Na+/H+ or K+/H+ antiporter
MAFDLEPYHIILLSFGLAFMAIAWLPLLLRDLPLSLPILCVLFGFATFGLFAAGDQPHPLHFPRATERVTEFVVIVALMGVGLKIGRPVGLRGWDLTWRLLAIAMPLSIAGAAILGVSLLGLGLAAALLLGAVLAPTDPVLAADVQLGPPGSGEEDEVRFALTSEAGLNDGLAFPFTYLALAVAAHGTVASWWLMEWVALDVFWRIAVGLGVGMLIGRGLAAILFRLPEEHQLAATGDSLVALSATLVAYGAAELAEGYGFLAVFVAALMVRAGERTSAYHARLHDFAEQIERMLTMLLLVLFGGAVATGLMAPLTWPAIGLALLFLFVVRPVSAWLSLIGTGRPRRERAFIAFFGIRGVGSFYYLAYALNHGKFEEPDLLWATVGLIVLLSIFIHGILVTPIIRRLDDSHPGAGRLSQPGGEPTS